jgi:hypothetical protein
LTGALESDYPVDEEILKAEAYPQYNVPIDDKDNQTTDSGIGGISFVQCATGKPDSRSATPTSSPFGSPKSAGRLSNMILVASVLYNVPQENQAVDKLPPLLHPLVHLNLQVGYLT